MAAINRFQFLKKELLGARREISFERAVYYTESWKKSEGQPNILRRARALQHVLAHMNISIREGEILAGNRTMKQRSGIASPEMSPYWIRDEIDSLYCRPQDSFYVLPEDKELFLKELYPYWAGKSLKDLIEPRLSAPVRQSMETRIVSINQTDKGQGHIIPDFEKMLNLGLDGLIEETAACEKRAGQNDFYQAAGICLSALQDHIGRYISLLNTLSEKETDETRRMELNRMKLASQAIQHKKPANLFEAVQLLWYFNIALQMESNASSISTGRFDQWMLPFYRNDIANGVPLEDIKDTLRMLWIKMNDVVLLRSRESAKYFAGFPTGYTIMLGGLTPEGFGADNELSWLILDTYDDIRLPQPNLGVRMNERLSRAFVARVAETIKLGTGVPHVFNDEVIIPGLLARGISLKDARDYAIVGCVEISVPGKMYGLHDIAMFNSPRLLELALRQYAGKMRSFTQLLALVEKEIEDNVALMVDGSNQVDAAHGQLAHIPLLSTLMHGCLESGRDVVEGGTIYNFSGVQGIGFQNLADALEVIRLLVFEEKQLSLAELVEIMANNWQGNEKLRQQCINQYPKYGNDIDSVDLLAARLLSKYNECCETYRNVRGGIFSPGSYTVSANIPLGEQVGATADGRWAQEQLADGGLSPMIGRDTRGPTAVLKSVSKLDHYQTTNGSLLNIKFHPNAFKDEIGTRKFVDFLIGWMRLKIQHIQFNIISRETLIDAQKHPDQYRDLVVRVAGYSALFVDLNEKTQNDIIARTEHGS
jgi:pyruvate formate-lyase/glycerol dehydratase family glycyl radical enzyme